MALITIRVKMLNSNALMPRYATDGAVGLDLSYAGDDSIYLQPLHRKLVPTGIALEIPNGYEGQIRPRSGLAVDAGITVLNSPGTIDSDYRGEIKILLIQLGCEAFYIKPGDRIAQLVIAPIMRCDLIRVENLNNTIRNCNGFGSTGIAELVEHD